MPGDVAGTRLSRSRFRLLAQEGGGSPKGAGAGDLLADCAELDLSGDTEVVRLVQVLKLVQKRGATQSREIAAPTRLLSLFENGAARENRLTALTARTAEIAKAVQATRAEPDKEAQTARDLMRTLHDRPDVMSDPIPMADRGQGRRVFARANPTIITGISSGRVPWEEMHSDGQVMVAVPHGTRLTPLEQSGGTGSATAAGVTIGAAVERELWRAAREVAEVQVQTSRASTPVWAVRAEFEQLWVRRGYRRGRLLRSIALAPSETIEITVKTWQKSTRRETTSTTRDETESLDISGEDRWSLAAVKEMAATTTVSANSKGGLSGGAKIPVEGIPVDVKADGAVTGSFEEQLRRSLSRTRERTQQQTVTAANSLKLNRSSQVETVSESGAETAVTQRLANPNACNTIAYHFFEVVEDYQVTTVPVDVQPIALLPLPVPLWTREQILCHACDIRPLLPCQDFHAGIEAASTLAEAAKRRVTVESLRTQLEQLTSNVDAQVSSLGAVIEQVAALTRAFDSARLFDFTIGRQQGDPSAIETFVADFGRTVEGLTKDVGAAVKKGVEAGESLLDAGSKAAAGAVDDAAEQIEKGVGALQEGAQALTGTVTSAADTISKGFKAGADALGSLFRSSSALARTAATQRQLGIGSAIWWQVAQVVAPELVGALRILADRWALLEGRGAQSSSEAEADVVETFFDRVGDLDLAFLKIDAGLAVVAVAGVGAVAAATAPFGPSVIVALATLALALEPYRDTAPDDEGMRSLLRRMGSRGTAVAEHLSLGQGADTTREARRREIDREMRSLARAEVEFERLRCHLTANVERYGPVIWAGISAVEVEKLAQDAGLPLGLVETNFESFVGTHGAVRVIDPEALATLGILWSRTAAGMGAIDMAPEGDIVTVPTPGVVAEARLGKCSACDDFVMQHRGLDLRAKEAAVRVEEERAAQQASETLRYQRRLESQDLSAPAPGDPVPVVRLEVDQVPD